MTVVPFFFLNATKVSLLKPDWSFCHWSFLSFCFLCHYLEVAKRNFPPSSSLEGLINLVCCFPTWKPPNALESLQYSSRHKRVVLMHIFFKWLLQNYYTFSLVGILCNSVIRFRRNIGSVFCLLVQKKHTECSGISALRFYLEGCASCDFTV